MSTKTTTTRIGLIVPSSNTTVEREFWTMAPRGVTVHSARMRITQNTLDGLREMEKDAEGAASLLSDAGVDLICYACTSGSFYGGIKHERDLASRLGRAADGVPVITTSEAVMAALATLRADRLAVATPYTDEINEKLLIFFRENGLTVTRLVGLQIVENLTVGRQEPNVAYETSRRADSPEAKAVFVSCTNFRTVEMIGRLEQDLAKPVTSSNVATFWYAMRKTGHSEPIAGLGRLLAMEIARPHSPSLASSS